MWAKDGGKQLGFEVEAMLMGWDNPITTFPQRLKDVTVEQVNAAIRKHLNPANLKIVVVTKDAQFFIKKIEEDVSFLVYQADDIVLSEKQKELDEFWARYPVSANEIVYRSSKEIFQ